MATRLEPKRADEQRTYEHDWSAFLGSDTIASQTTTANGVTVDSSSVDAGNTSTRFRLSGGTDGTVAVVTQKIVTANGEEETELFTLYIQADDPISLSDAKSYLRVRTNDEDAKIAAMIPRARLWVEDHTGLALVRRQFEERRRTEHGAIRLFKGPLVSVDSVTYGDALTYVPRDFAPDTRLVAASGASWPTLDQDDAFEITYTAGFAEGEIDDRLIGAMYALIEGEFSDGYAYPQRATDAAERCCAYLRQMVA